MAIGSKTPSLREEDRSLLMAMAPMMRLVLKGRKPFCLAVSPAKQKMLSLRPRRLCGENSILDKHGEFYNLI
jgi:hypothetical protein